MDDRTRQGTFGYRWLPCRCWLAVALACVLPAVEAQANCDNPPPGWVFCTDFEEGSFAVWDDWDGNPAPDNTLVADPGPFDVAGNHVARLVVPPGRGTADLVKVLPGTYDVLYARWYVKWEPGFDFTVGQHGSGLHAGDRSLLAHSGDRPNGSDWFSSWIEPDGREGRFNAYTYYAGMYMDCADPAGSCWGDHLPCLADEGQVYCTQAEHRETVTPPLMQAGRWYCVEIMMDGGNPTAGPVGASGVLNFWIDGQEIGPWDELWLRSTGNLRIGILWLSLFFHGTHGTAGVLFDDVVVSTMPIGPGPRDPGTPVEAVGWGTMKALFR